MKRRASFAFALALLTAAAGCSDDFDDHIAWVEGRAEAMRELELETEVPVTAFDRDLYDTLVRVESLATPEADVDEMLATYGRLGFYDAGDDLRSSSASARGLVAAWYSSTTAQITLIGEPPDNVVVHEFVHALQDQHFDLGAYHRGAPTSDAHLARTAAIEGDATLAQVRFILLDEHGVDLNALDWSRYFPDVAASSEDILAGAEGPVVFRASSAFNYSHGLIYCAHNLTGAAPDSPAATSAFPYDWSREDALFGERTPADARAILTFDAPGDRVTVGLDDVPAAFADRFERLDWDTLGAWYSYLLFRPVAAAAGAEAPRPFAATWSGDRALFLRDKASQQVGVVWASAWSDAAAAGRVEAALRALHGIVADADEPRLGTAKDGEAVWLARDDRRVAFVKNLPATDAEALADAALAPETASPKSAKLRLRAPLGQRLGRGPHLPPRPPPSRPDAR